MFGNILGNKSNIHERDLSKFYYFILLKTDDNFSALYLDKINKLLDAYAPLKRIDKYKLKSKSKPSATLGLQKFITVKNKLLTNFINKKDSIYTKQGISYLIQKI